MSASRGLLRHWLQPVCSQSGVVEVVLVPGVRYAAVKVESARVGGGRWGLPSRLTPDSPRPDKPAKLLEWTALRLLLLCPTHCAITHPFKLKILYPLAHSSSHDLSPRSPLPARALCRLLQILLLPFLADTSFQHPPARLSSFLPLYLPFLPNTPLAYLVSLIFSPFFLPQFYSGECESAASNCFKDKCIWEIVSGLILSGRLSVWSLLWANVNVDVVEILGCNEERLELGLTGG